MGPRRAEDLEFVEKVAGNSQATRRRCPYILEPMPSPGKHTRKKVFACLLVMFGPFCGVEAAEPDYLKVVTNYANALLTYGRDNYNVRSPLIATTLDRSTFAMIERDGGPDIAGVRGRDRVFEGANPMHDQNLYQILYALTDLTGDSTYAAEADRTLSFFLECAPHSSTDLLAWGEHMGWDFHEERRIHKVGGKLPEVFRPWVLWDRCYLLNPKVSFRFAKGVWENQIGDHESGNYGKHAIYDQHGPMVNQDEPRHAGFYLRTWARAFQETQDDRYLQHLSVGTWAWVFAERRNRSLDVAMEALVRFLESRRSPESGAIPADSATPIQTEPWRGRIVLPVDNLSLAVDLGWSAERVEPLLASDMRLTAARIDSAFLKMRHDPARLGFLTGADVYTLQPFGPEEGQRSALWSDRAIPNPFRDHGAWVVRSHAAVANICYERFKQTDLRKYHDLVITTARRYLASDPDVSGVGSPGFLQSIIELIAGADDPVYPRMMAQVIELMLNAHELSGDRAYLQRAEHFARWSIQTYLGDSSLPRASHRHDHYEAVTGGDALMMALLDLWTVKQGRQDEVDLVWVDR